MAYRAEISRANRSCIFFLIDQSASMEEGSGQDPTKSKMDGVADAINRLLHTIVLRCATAEGVKDIYDLGVIGYGHTIVQGFGGQLEGRELVSIAEVADQPVRVEDRTVKMDDGAGGIVEQQKKFPVWFEPQANGMTPMTEAYQRVKQILDGWLPGKEESYPPIVINITDGESTDGDPTQAAADLANLATNDGNVLVFNCHLSKSEETPVVFPGSDDGLTDELAQRLYQMSSLLPVRMREDASTEGYDIVPTSRGFVFNADLVQLIGFLDIGTRASSLR